MDIWVNFSDRKFLFNRSAHLNKFISPSVSITADLPFMIPCVFFWMKEKKKKKKMQTLHIEVLVSESLEPWFVLWSYSFFLCYMSFKVTFSRFFYKIKDIFHSYRSCFVFFFPILKHFIFKEQSYLKYGHNRITASSKLGYFSPSPVIETRTYTQWLDLLLIL